MNKKIKFLFIVIAVGILTGCAGIYPGITGEIKKVATGFKFTEGPAVAPNGDIYFTDIPNNKIYVWSTKGSLSIYLENTGGANGLLFDNNGNLLVCEGGNLYITTDTVLVYNPEGKLLQKIEVPARPSNICFGKNGEMLFITARTSLYGIKK